jgi:hypothetical protein
MNLKRLQRIGDNVSTFVIALLLVVSFLTFGATMLIHYPQKVDSFLNSNEPVESKHVMTRELSQKQGLAPNAVTSGISTAKESRYHLAP